MKRKLYIPLLGLTVILCGSCIKKTLYDTPHPFQGVLVVTPDWSLRSEDAPLPDSYVMRIGKQQQTATGNSALFSSLLPPGKQQLLVYNTPTGITVNGNTATVDTLTDGTLTPLPGHLMAGAQQITVQPDDTISTTITMKQYTRTLTLVLKIKPGDENRIAATAATLSGIASAIDLIQGSAAGTGERSVRPLFTPGEEQGLPRLSATLRLTGIAEGKQQLLTIDLTLNDGHQHSVTTDLTTGLRDFADANGPLRLEATLSLPRHPDLAADITDWILVDNGEIEIET